MWWTIVFYLHGATLSLLHFALWPLSLPISEVWADLFGTIFGPDEGGRWDGQTPVRNCQMFSGLMLHEAELRILVSALLGTKLDQRTSCKANRLPGLYFRKL